MKKIVLLIAALAAMILPALAVVGSSTSADASVGAYTRLYRPARGWVGAIQIACHGGGVKNLSWYEDSISKCADGWVNGLANDIPPTMRVHVLNKNTLNQTDYACGYDAANIGGGYYDVWVNEVGC